LGPFFGRIPNAEASGYSQVSLRDEIQKVVNLRQVKVAKWGKPSRESVANGVGGIQPIDRKRQRLARSRKSVANGVDGMPEGGHFFTWAGMALEDAKAEIQNREGCKHEARPGDF